MKIGILTLPLHTNYGGILQAYALQTVLSRMGHNVEVLQKNPEKFKPSFLSVLRFIKNIGIKLFKNRKFPLLLERKKKLDKPIIEQHTSAFISKYIHIRSIDSFQDIQESDYDAIIVGSDQIWRAAYFKQMWKAPIKEAFLNFTKGWKIRRFSYAASFGLDNLEEYTNSEIEQCKQSIKNFDSISVRETCGVNLCKDNFNVPALQVLDPTMLLGKEDYISLVEKSNVPKSSGELLCYILDSTSFKEEVINRVANDMNLKPFKANANTEDIFLDIEKRIQPPVEQWLRGFMDAKYVVTDSFHACVFAIIFKKPFIVIGNEERGLSRLISLLSIFNLQDRMINNRNQLDKIPLNFDIQYSNIDIYNQSLSQLKSL